MKELPFLPLTADLLKIRFLTSTKSFNRSNLIISCTETWLKPEVHTSEMFPNTLDYQVFRDDRTTNQGGGVLIAISMDFICQEQP